MVYFVRDTVTGHIKIGFTSTDPLARVGTLQTSTPRPLALLGVIPRVTQKAEAKLHYKFKEFRVQGEWFDPVPEIEEYIAVNTIQWVDLRLRKSKDKREAKEQEAAIREHVAIVALRGRPGDDYVKAGKRWVTLKKLGLTPSEIADREGQSTAQVELLIAQAERNPGGWQSLFEGKPKKVEGEKRTCQRCEAEFYAPDKDKYCKPCQKIVIRELERVGYLRQFHWRPYREIDRDDRNGGDGSNESPSFENAVRAMEG